MSKGAPALAGRHAGSGQLTRSARAQVVEQPAEPTAKRAGKDRVVGLAGEHFRVKAESWILAGPKLRRPCSQIGRHDRILEVTRRDVHARRESTAGISLLLLEPEQVTVLVPERRTHGQYPAEERRLGQRRPEGKQSAVRM